MKNILKQILEEKDFTIDENCLKDESSFLAERTKHNKFDFLTVMFVSEIDANKEKIKEKIEEYFLTILEGRQNLIGLEKNLSLLILLEVNSLEVSNEINSLIFDIEEDPYDFKKYVLVYTKDQVEILKRLKEESDSEITETINQILNDSMKFSRFKSNEDSEDKLIYDLVSKLFIKIPFLNMEYNQQTINSLLREIVGSIEVEDENIWESLMKLKEDSGDDPDIEDILECVGVDKIG